MFSVYLVVISGPSGRYFARPLCAHPVRTAGAFGTAMARGPMPTVGRRGFRRGGHPAENGIGMSGAAAATFSDVMARRCPRLI